ncbi:MAG: hypothetical protein HYV63_05565 [Candidatus Schekmanbacteria bacterium]|nr:hypothetical protein [Candidatus Schekmanbacteria bacterium]
MRSQRHVYGPIVLLLATVTVSACQRSRETPSGPRLALSSKVELPSDQIQTPGVFVAEYIHHPGTDFAPPPKAMVYAHFVDERGRILFQDDHAPLPPMSEWKPGSTISYRRLIYAPPLELDSRLTVVVGVYDPVPDGARYQLAGGDSRDAVPASLAATRSIIPFTPIEGLDTIFLEGWYAPEFDPVSDNHWRWSGPKSVASVPRPKRDSVLFLSGSVPATEFAAPANVKLLINGQELASITPDGTFVFMKAVPPALLGEQPRADLTVTCDQSFVPAAKGGSSDTRQLSVLMRVLHVQEGIPAGFSPTDDTVSLAGFVQGTGGSQR